ncbi:hypothetical protein TorRG33x02_162050 [Trema orientale]|uniref:25S rRNA (uridine-N(3))-methyltransferase BMT5-like domain-containing protein n=1 Tax=Trema orientale TaxID=63057 RepID=A0A2P5ER38_TREOI|nr:hypothetical protein TorRG33x02_162050 [Trema orientale]
MSGSTTNVEMQYWAAKSGPFYEARGPHRIGRHKNLLRGFFGSAREMLNEGGEIHVSHRDDHPYRKWELEKLAQNAGLLLKEKVSFRKEQYPGYHNKRGSVIQGNKKFPLGYPFTFKFFLDHRRNQETETTLSYTTTTTTISDHEDHVLMPEVSADKTTILMISTGSSSTVTDHDDHQSDDIVDGNHVAFDEKITNDPYEMPAVGANNNHDDRDSYETTLISTGRTSTVTEYDDDEDNIHAVGDNDERDDHIIDDKAENKIITDDRY